MSNLRAGFGADAPRPGLSLAGRHLPAALMAPTREGTMTSHPPRQVVLSATNRFLEIG